MSSTPPANDTLPPTGIGSGIGTFTPGETAPSQILTDTSTLTRVIGVFGLFSTVLGLVVVVTSRWVGPRIIPESLGYVSLGVGLAMLLYHAVTDREQEIRRMYGLLAGSLLVVGLMLGLVPGPFADTGADKTVGYFLLPWGLGCGLLSLLFAMPFARHETDEGLRTIALKGMLGTGCLLALGALVAGLIAPGFLAGPGLALALLGVAFVCGYLNQVDADDAIAYATAFALGAVGAAILFYVFARTVFPTVLYEGPSVLRAANQTLDRWSVAGRALVILAFAGVAGLGVLGSFHLWQRVTLAIVGLVGAGVFIAASLNTQISIAPKPFLVPGGLLLALLGSIYLVVALSVCSDFQLVTLTRRELSTYFLSPLGFLVLGGMAACQFLGYWLFWDGLTSLASRRPPRALPEPIVEDYLFGLFPILCVIFPIPALTMRLVAEEKERGTLEVLLTAPVNEWPVVLSKFLGTWLFFMICWLPAALFLIGVRVEGGAPFDYRPLLSFYAALAACAAAFVACGLFFSALTRNQLVAAVLTFMVMLFLVICFFVKDMVSGLGPTAQVFFTRLSFLQMWRESLRGQLPLRDLLVWVSAAVFGLFLSVKILEARKWN